MQRFYVFLLAFLAFGPSMMAERIKYSINEGWTLQIAGREERVNLPHTWNALDAMDDVPGYYRGEGCYRRKLILHAEEVGRSVFLHFEGVQQKARVCINGKEVGSHIGGYTAFCFDVTRYVHEGENMLEVYADNSYDENVPPLSADFTFYGGIYRDVSVLLTDPIHVSTTHYGSSGVYFSTPTLNETEANVSIDTYMDNALPKPQTVVLVQQLLDPTGTCQAKAIRKVKLPAGALHQPTNIRMKVTHPRLWDVDNPQLYRLQTQVQTLKGEVLDEVNTMVGIRQMELNTADGFRLNGHPVKLIGTSRHQDYAFMGNALTDEMHIRDVQQIKDMGSNFLRISHYPQDPLVLETCNRLGIVTSVEIPVVNAVTMSKAFSDNCDQMMHEMIYQNFNAPSVCIWAYMNEVLLRPPYDSDKSIGKEEYLACVHECTKRVHETAKRLDSLRFTMLPIHDNMPIYEQADIVKEADILGFNLYNGWYSNGLSNFEKTLDKWHQKYPELPFMISEYGADNDTRVHSYNPERFDYSEEYANIYHQHYLPVILQRPFVVGAAVWNYNDFGSESRGYAVPHINLKGLVTTTRQPKDSYRYYQAMLTHQPMVYICGHDWPTRSDQMDATGKCIRRISVYSNQPSVTLALNGESIGTQTVADGVAAFDVPFHDGINRIVATASGCSDVLDVKMNLVPADARQLRELNVMMGSRHHFYDAKADLDWMPEQAYTSGSWGYVGGQAFTEKNWAGALPTSSLNILATDADPLYQTQRRALEHFRADVADGDYVVYLYFAELDGGTKEALAYELGNSTVIAKASDRQFDVQINGTTVLHDLDVASATGITRPMCKRIPVSTEGGQGLDVAFLPKKGDTMLTAIRILKVR